MGDSGCGKSTALSLVAQYYRPDKGSVLIGGTDTAAYAPERVLENVSIVDQDVFLFDDSIAENVRYAKPGASDEEIRAACRLANADGFIERMPEGYDSRIGSDVFAREAAAVFAANGITAHLYPRVAPLGRRAAAAFHRSRYLAGFSHRAT